MKIYAYILLITLSVAHASFAQRPFSKEVWLNETNTPVEVNCIALDDAGYMWLGTEQGLYQYDGKDIRPIKTIDKLSVTAISAFYNNLYIGFDDGTFGMISENNFVKRNLSGPSPETAINDITIMAGNNVLLSTAGQSIFLVNHNSSYRFTTAHGLSDEYIYTTVFPEKYIALAATDRGINEVIINANKSISVHVYTTANGLSDNIVRVIKPMKEKCWSWIGTHQGGLSLYCSKMKEIWTPEIHEPWTWGQINDILPIGINMAWVCTEDGYLLKAELLDSNNLQITPYHYPGKKIKHIISDGTGNIWCATNTGLLMLTTGYISQISLNAPYNLSKVTAITSMQDDKIMLALENKLFMLNEGEEHTLEYKGEFPSSVTTLLTDKDNNLWIGTFGDGLWKATSTGKPHKISSIPVLQNESILDITSCNDKVWVAGLNGVQELAVQNGTLQLIKTHNKHSGIGSDYVYDLFCDGKNNIWMGTDGAGICKYSSGEYIHWDSTDGMISDVVYSITEDVKGNIWASTLNNGLLKFDGSEWLQYNNPDGLQDLNISTINANSTGQVITVHALGIDEWYPTKKQFRHYDRKTGIGIRHVSKSLHLSAKTSNGEVYIPYDGGLICFHNIYREQRLSPKVTISSISTYFKEVSLHKKRFTHSQNHISFKYNGINYANPGEIYYRYKLEGFNDMWIETGDNNVTFPKLPSGYYNFIIQASANRAFTTYDEATYHFKILKPFWMQPWFLVIVALLIWLIAYLYIKLREKNIKKLSSLQRERMLFEYEHLKSQVNPHFLFNSLNTLTNIIEEDKDAALKYTNQLSDLYRNMLSYRNKDLILLGEEWEIIENYLFIQETRFGAALKTSIEIPDLLLRTKKIVPMAVQLLVENAIKHNIVSISKPLYIIVEADSHYLTVKNSYQPKISKEKGAGLGLRNIRKRYSLLTKKPVSYYIQDDLFVIKLPLI